MQNVMLAGVVPEAAALTELSKDVLHDFACCGVIKAVCRIAVYLEFDVGYMTLDRPGAGFKWHACGMLAQIASLSCKDLL